MTEQVVLKFVSGFSAYTLAIFGVDAYSLIYALVGTMLLLSNQKKTTRLSALIYVTMSTIGGAATGVWAAGHLDPDSKAALFVACMVCGGGINTMIATAIGAGNNRINQLGGVSKEPLPDAPIQAKGDENG